MISLLLLDVLYDGLLLDDELLVLEVVVEGREKDGPAAMCCRSVLLE